MHFMEVDGGVNIGAVGLDLSLQLVLSFNKSVVFSGQVTGEISPSGDLSVLGFLLTSYFIHTSKFILASTNCCLNWVNNWRILWMAF